MNLSSSNLLLSKINCVIFTFDWSDREMLQSNWLNFVPGVVLSNTPKTSEQKKSLFTVSSPGLISLSQLGVFITRFGVQPALGGKMFLYVRQAFSTFPVVVCSKSIGSEPVIWLFQPAISCKGGRQIAVDAPLAILTVALHAIDSVGPVPVQFTLFDPFSGSFMNAARAKLFSLRVLMFVVISAIYHKIK